MGVLWVFLGLGVTEGVCVLIKGVVVLIELVPIPARAAQAEFI